MALVDEFQDTDPIQWDIVRLAFGDGATTLVLIGDPKQAIYAFRGADVYAYLDAARTAGTAGDARRQLAQRPGARSTPTTPCFGGTKLGHAGIEYRTVRAADATPAAAPPRRSQRRRAAGADRPPRRRRSSTSRRRAG